MHAIHKMFEESYLPSRILQRGCVFKEERRCVRIVKDVVKQKNQVGEIVQQRQIKLFYTTKVRLKF